jgi:hypothetical protein
MKMKTLIQSCSLLLLACAACHLACADEVPEKKHPVPMKTQPKPKPERPEVRPADAHESAKSVHPHPEKAPEESRRAGKKETPEKRPELPRKPHWEEAAINLDLHPRPAVIFTGPAWHYDRAYESEVQLLRAAYLALSRADHDYAGHRAAAMRQTALAGDLLGIRLRGDGHGEEPQEVSDMQLKVAGNLLNRTFDGFAYKGHREAADHVAAAINEIRVALHFI